MIFLKDVNYLSISVVIPAVPASLQQGAVAPKCSKVSQLGPVKIYLKSHFLGMHMRKFKTSGVRARPKTYAYVIVRRKGHGQLCFARAPSTCGLWYVALHPRAVEFWQTITWRPKQAALKIPTRLKWHYRIKFALHARSDWIFASRYSCITDAVIRVHLHGIAGYAPLQSR